MTQPIIQVENFGKCYRLSHRTRGVGEYRSLGETVSQLGRNILGRLRHPLAGTGETVEDFWALKDVNFEIAQGDRVGIIGRNGAGKSTLLKLLCRITEPTTGKAVLRGRVASLLEVGTGFHPELSGRENIYLNGSILGMKHAEIKRKFDEIVDFSGVEKFLDTPVKRYSSGMYVRLAFAVAAHLEPEILLIDEVLAVGDAEFQKKCLGKMEDISRNSGRTILFVSHNMNAVQSLCNRGLLLAGGQLQSDSDINQIIRQYTSLNGVSDQCRWPLRPESGIQLTGAAAVNAAGLLQKEFFTGEPVGIKVSLAKHRALENAVLSLSLYDLHKNRIFTINQPLAQYAADGNEIHLLFTLPQRFLTPGDYSWLMAVVRPNAEVFDSQNDICPFAVFDNLNLSPYPPGTYGAVFADYQVMQVD